MPNSKNPRNAGKKPKFNPLVSTKVIRPLIPIAKEKKILEAIDEICKDDLFVK